MSSTPKQTVFEKLFKISDEYGFKTEYNLKQLGVLFPILAKGKKITVEALN